MCLSVRSSMKYLPALILALLLCLACANPSPEEMASIAAKGYYTHLVNGEYEAFLDGKDGADSLPKAYREQLLTSYRQFMSQQNRDHHGILDIRVSNAKTETTLNYTNVFLVLCFSDSVNEEIVVPMVERNGSWRMK